MINLDDIASYFVSAGLATGKGVDLYIGKIDSQKEQVLGLYNDLSTTNELSVGGLQNTTEESRSFTVLVHWDEDMIASENKAIAIYEHFRANPTPIIGGKQCIDVLCTIGEPRYIHTDKNNIHEFVLDYEIRYNRI